MQAQISHYKIPRALFACYQVGMDLNLRIREIRQERDLTLADLAGKVGVSIPHLSEVERGKKNLNNHLLVRLADALGVTPEDLIASDNRSALAALHSELSSLEPEDRDRVRAFVAALRKSRAGA